MGISSTRHKVNVMRPMNPAGSWALLACVRSVLPSPHGFHWRRAQLCKCTGGMAYDGMLTRGWHAAG